MGRWGDGEMGRWGDGEMGKWGNGESDEGLVFHEAEKVLRQALAHSRSPTSVRVAWPTANRQRR
ncbi:MAG: hypothetical protein F6J94_02990 [Moorea sp. SIO1F2]|uniref:hypothetical protein n=1 Tax=unclassified Moorena TaxID=2683338 RepID=UPI0013BB8007|nr:MULTISPECIES: hypothetical protein [unclassified Moorena]NEN98921.1 hypothetical protein [Moorena sp. SIO3I7]NEO05911.1 hypothetical protein [Moorena sp. SIO3I8]NEO18460.1 hypothetical protein [Moorena sp. SIO4A5]NEP25444.1 hypothetical protein [Moorena sp. SIO3I6]NEQ58521.1 hypothetical protein [Moorena sp. SIO4A1]